MLAAAIAVAPFAGAAMAVEEPAFESVLREDAFELRDYPATVVAEVTVAAGELTVDRVQCFLDCGQVINPLGLTGSAESSVAWALSSLWAETTFRAGAAEATNFPGYPVLPMSRMPAVEVHTVDSGFPPSGAGEIPVPGVAPAVANAIFAATGRRLRRLPLPLEELAGDVGGSA
jgi:isoquinoline 1-oxidoreductase beta subunit